LIQILLIFHALLQNVGGDIVLGGVAGHLDLVPLRHMGHQFDIGDIPAMSLRIKLTILILYNAHSISSLSSAIIIVWFLVSEVHM
jgi:hypothetical protein